MASSIESVRSVFFFSCSFFFFLSFVCAEYDFCSYEGSCFPSFVCFSKLVRFLFLTLFHAYSIVRKRVHGWSKELLTWLSITDVQFRNPTHTHAHTAQTHTYCAVTIFIRYCIKFRCNIIFFHTLTYSIQHIDTISHLIFFSTVSFSFFLLSFFLISA